jgi:DNA primase
MHIDTQAIKENADLLSIIGRDTQLKKVASTGGGEWAGACPMCGGRDRFRVQPYKNIWMCRQCSPSWDSIIGYIARRDNLDPKSDFLEICRRAGGGDIPTTYRHQSEPDPRPAYAPALDQDAAHQVVALCESALWDPKNHKVLEYLHSRGLRDETIKHFHLGYNGTGHPEVFGREINGLWIPRGIVIPCEIRGIIWYLKIRLMPGVPVRCNGKIGNRDCKSIISGPGPCPECGEINKYRGVKGNKTAAFFNADELRGYEAALVVEGEFDCMIAYQEIRDIIPAITLGSATNRPDMATWGAYLLPIKILLSSYDADKAGEVGAQALAEIIGDRLKLVGLQEGVKDINDFYLAGADLGKWILGELDFHDPLPNCPVNYAEILGGTVSHIES